MYCILGLCFLCKRVGVLEAGVGTSSGEKERCLLERCIRGSRPWVPQPRAWAVGRRQCEGGAIHFSRGQVTKDAASGEHRSLGCNNFLGLCPIRHAHRGLWGVWTSSGRQGCRFPNPPKHPLKESRGLHGWPVHTTRAIGIYPEWNHSHQPQASSASGCPMFRACVPTNPNDRQGRQDPSAFSRSTKHPHISSEAICQWMSALWWTALKPRWPLSCVLSAEPRTPALPPRQASHP